MMEECKDAEMQSFSEFHDFQKKLCASAPLCFNWRLAFYPMPEGSILVP